MESEHRYDEIHEILAGVRAESFRLAAFMGPMPGIGRSPVALMRGWNDLLRADETAAAANGRAVLAFVAEQRVTKWNAWHLQMLEAQAQLLLGAKAVAVVKTRESLQFALPNRDARIYRDYLAAMTLAWAGEDEQSVELLDSVLEGARVLAPLLIAGNPKLAVPLAGNARFAQLQAALRTETLATRVE
jgi:hypothetical protein